MSIAINFYSGTRTGRYCFIFVCYALLAGAAGGQNNQTQLEARYGFTVADAIAKVNSGDFAGVHLGLIVEAKAVQAIPDLETQFMRTPDALDKASIAQALVKLGDKDDSYWKFLVQRATLASESDEPNPINFDTQGKIVKGQGPSPEFIAWAKAHNQDPNTAATDAIYVRPGNLMLLAGTEDSRAIPILRRALSSPNPMIQTAAARGLAEIKDKDSVPLIIDACKKRPTDAAAMIAESLVYFDDPRAQNAVDQYIPKDFARALREARLQGRGPFH